MPVIDRIESDEALPARAEVVVIGGGVIGVTAALELAERGVSVALCEKGHVAGEQSSRNWGWCRKMGRDPAELPLAIQSLRLWEGMSDRVGADTGFVKAGILYTCDTAKELAGHESWVEQARLHQVDSRLLSGDEVEAMVPGATRRFAGGLYTASDGRAEPFKAVPAMAEAARAKGATIHQSCAVRGLETQGGRIAGVVTERGRIACSSVVVAAGAWARLFLGNFGVNFPQLKILGSVMRTAPLPGLPDIAVGGSDFAFRKRQDGGYTVVQRNANIAEIVPDSFRLFLDFAPALKAQWHELRLRVGGRLLEEWRTPRRWRLDEMSPFERVRTLDPLPNARVQREAKTALAGVHPAFRDMRVVESWGGLVDVTPDAVPVIDEVAGVPGLFIAAGFSGHGFGIGPGAGRLVADIVTGAEPLVDRTPFRLGRFKRAGLRRAA